MNINPSNSMIWLLSVLGAIVVLLLLIAIQQSSQVRFLAHRAAEVEKEESPTAMHVLHRMRAQYIAYLHERMRMHQVRFLEEDDWREQYEVEQFNLLMNQVEKGGKV